MNYKMIVSILGKTMIMEAVLMLLPMCVGFIAGESSYLSFLIPMAALVAVGLPLSFIKIKNKSIYAREGFVIVALVWVIYSLAGALPFVIDGYIPSYVDAVFETVSGFTTTGATILSDVESMGKGLMFWRMFTHWIGGMGVLVFVLAILPSNNSGIMHVFRTESPGPTVGKFVSKLRFTARILYAIYFGLSVIMVIFLLCGGMSLYEAVINTFATAGTGGFSNKNISIGFYDNVYYEMVIAVFMFIFSVNFNFYYLILIGSFKKAFCSEEVRAYLILTVVATLAIALNLLSSVENFGQALRYAFFQVTSLSSTTGFSTTDFNLWPAFSKCVLIVCMMVGACAGSTGGGIKVSRLVMLSKSALSDTKKMISPRTVTSLKFEGEPVDSDTMRNVKAFIIVWLILVVLSTLILCADPFVNTAEAGGDVLTSLTATLSCIGNIGPGFDLVGPMGNYGGFSPFSKIWMSLIMLAGRLELFPMLILFSPRTWRRN